MRLNSTSTGGLQANSMSRWITFGLNDLNCLGTNDTLGNQMADVFHGPLLASLVGDLPQTVISMVNMAS